MKLICRSAAGVSSSGLGGRGWYCGLLLDCGLVPNASSRTRSAAATIKGRGRSRAANPSNRAVAETADRGQTTHAFSSPSSAIVRSGDESDRLIKYEGRLRACVSGIFTMRGGGVVAGSVGRERRWLEGSDCDADNGYSGSGRERRWPGWRKVRKVPVVWGLGATAATSPPLSAAARGVGKLYTRAGRLMAGD